MKSFKDRVKAVRPHYYCTAMYGFRCADQFMIINGSTGQPVTTYFKTQAGAWKSALWKLETELP